MAQILCLLALSTKEMKEGRISGSIHSIFCFVADDETERFMNRILGRTDVEDALKRLDVLTMEENLMTAARNLEVTHRVDVNVVATQEVIHDVDDNVKETKELTRGVRENVITIDDNVKVTRHGAQTLSTSSYISPNRGCDKQRLMNNNVRSNLVVSSPIVTTEAHSQGTSYGGSFENGSLLRIPPSIIILPVTSNTKERRCGSSRVTISKSGRRMARYCGSVAIVCFSLFTSLSLPLMFFPGFQRALARVSFGMQLPNDSRYKKLIAS